MRSLSYLLMILSILSIFTCDLLAINGDMGRTTEPLTDGSADYPYLIEDFADFQEFSDVNNADFYWVQNVHTKLMTDIDLDPDLLDRKVYTQAPIAGDTIPTSAKFDGVYYEGVFNGNTYAVNNLNIDGAHNCGLFGGINSSSSIINLEVKNVNIICSGRYIGSVAGRSYAQTISNCFTSGIINASSQVGGIAGFIDGSTIENGISHCNLSGGETVGGIAGFINSGSINNCQYTGTLNNTQSAPYQCFGGLAGYIQTGNISNSSASGSIAGNWKNGGLVGKMLNGSISNSYADVNIPGGIITGGLVGENISAEIIECYSKGEVTGDTAGGLIGLNEGNITLCYSNCKVESITEIDFDISYYIGGLVGRNSGSISKCYSTGKICAEGYDCYVGGLIGSNVGIISDSFSMGDVSFNALRFYGFSGGFAGVGSSITNCFSTGAVLRTGMEPHSYYGGVGPFIGSSVQVNSCFWDVEVSGLGVSGDNNCGATGKTTAEMQDIQLFLDSGWDFVGESDNGDEDIWIMDEYPEINGLDAILSNMVDVVGVELMAAITIIEDNSFIIGDIGYINSDVIPDGHVVNQFPSAGSIVPQNKIVNLAISIGSWPIVPDLVGMELAEAELAIVNADLAVGVIIYRFRDDISAGQVISSNPVAGVKHATGSSVDLIVSAGSNPLLGSGTVTDPYLISSVFDFDVFCDVRFTDYFWTENIYTKLMCDVDLSGKVYGSAPISPDAGEQYDSFVGILYSGIFDGNGFAIDNLSIENHEIDINFVGLFGSTSADAIIKNVICSNCSIEGYRYVGGIVGYNNGLIVECGTSGILSPDSIYSGGVCAYNDGEIKECYTEAEIDGNMRRSDYVGGLCGYNNGHISCSYATGTVLANNYCGGLCGYNDGDITYSYSVGRVVYNYRDTGGFCGYNRDVIESCFWDVNTSRKDFSDGGTGLSTADMQNYNTYIDEGWDFVDEVDNGADDIWIMSDYPSLVWQQDVYSIVPDIIDFSQAEAEVILAESDLSIGQIFHDFSNEIDEGNIIDMIPSAGTRMAPGSPVILIVSFGVNPLYGTGSESDPYIINNLNDFDRFADPNYAEVFWAEGIYTMLKTDLNLADRTYRLSPIAPDLIKQTGAYSDYNDFDGYAYSGFFEGKGHIISNLTINNENANRDFIGLFGKLEKDGKISNLALADCSISGSVGNSYLVGGVCAHNKGMIENCFVKGSVGAINDQNNLPLSYLVGGICGVNDGGSVIQCYTSCELFGESYVGGICGFNKGGVVCNSYAIGSVTGGDYLGGAFGGLVGGNKGEISNSYSLGNVTGKGVNTGGLAGINRGEIYNCYSTSSVSGFEQVGGSAGHNSGGIYNCFSTGTVSGYYKIGGMVGYSDGGMQSNCFWDVESSGIGSSGDDNFGATGKTTNQLQDPNLAIYTSADWDFVKETDNGTEDLWHMPYNAVGYPMLWWQRDIPADRKGSYGVDITDFACLSENWLDKFTLTDLSELAQYWLEGK